MKKLINIKMKKIRVLAIIPARKGSKGLKNKNIRKLKGKSLVEHAIIQAKISKFITDISVSTDSKKIKQNPILKKKNKAQESSNTPVRYFNRRERLPIFFNKLFM